MKDIKFRTEVNGQHIYSDQFAQEGKIDSLRRCGELSRFFDVLSKSPNPDFYVEEYTGFKDGYLIDIYDGETLKDEHGEEWLVQKGTRGFHRTRKDGKVEYIPLKQAELTAFTVIR